MAYYCQLVPFDSYHTSFTEYVALLKGLYQLSCLELDDYVLFVMITVLMVFWNTVCILVGSPDIRLVDGDGSYRGRLEIRHTGEGGPEWGTVCNKNFNFAAASVVCRQLGYTGAYRVQSFRSGPTGGVIWLENVQCNGNEVSIMDCKYDGWGNTSCSHHDDDVGIICIGD